MTIRAVLSFSAVLTLGGCNLLMAGDFREGLPSFKALALEVPVPASESQMRVTDPWGSARTELGKASEFHELTRLATGKVNGATRDLLQLVQTVSQLPPTSIEGDVAVWGPFAHPHEETRWRLSVERGAVAFTYTVEGWDKAGSADDAVTVLAGTHTPGEARGFGAGELHLDVSAWALLPGHGSMGGEATIDYARASEDADATVGASFTQVVIEEGESPVDAEYLYVASPAEGGTFQFVTAADIEDDGSNDEALTIRSRWLPTGEGRADVTTSGGDLGTEETLSDCWDDTFASVYREASWTDEASLNWGSVADCAFGAAEYADL